MNRALVGALGAAVLLSAAGRGYAQRFVGPPVTATVRAVVRVVKVAQPGAARLQNATVGMPVRPGGRIRTAGRSAAGLRFPDQSVLRLGELTEVLVNNPARRDTRVIRGEVFAHYRAPGTISGGYAVCAVRGTKVHYVQHDDSKTAEVRCYDGRVFVGAGDNPVAAGAAATVTPTSLTDTALVDSPEDYNGGEIRFTDGPYNGQVRRISSFNAKTGTVVFAPALAAGRGNVGDVNGYLLVKKPGRTIVELHTNQGTVIPIGREPQAPRSVPGAGFAYLNQHPFFAEMEEGVDTTTYNGSPEHQTQQTNDAAIREARDITLHTGAGPVCIFGTPGGFGLRRALERQVRRDGDVSGSSPESRVMPRNLMTPYGAEITEKVAFRIEPFVITSDQTGAIGTRARIQASSGQAYMELGYRYLHVGNRDVHNVSEGFLQLRGDYGELTAGRQHLFLRLANNTNVGTLLGLETTDAVTYKLPIKRFSQTVGYIFDTGPLGNGDIAANIGGSFRTFFARGQAGLWKGNAGYSLMAPTDGGRKIGWSVDAAQPIFPNKLDIYGEIGDDTKDHNLYVVGLYLPALYHKAKIDAFLEYQRRQDVDERWSLRVRRDVYKGLFVIGFVDLGRDTFHGGGGLMYSFKFR